MKNKPALLGLLGLTAILAGCHHQNPSEQSPTPSPGTAPPVVGTNPSSTTTLTPPPRGKAVIYVVDATHSTDADNGLAPKTVHLRNAQDPAREALNALLQAPDTPIPAGTTLKSIKIADGLATVDFSRSPVDETGGEEKQSQALEAIQRTLGQFPDIARIQIEVKGQVPDSLGEAAGGPMDVIRPSDTVQEAGGA